MKMLRQGIVVFMLLGLSLFSSGCTGSKVLLTPKLDSIPPLNLTKPCGTVAVREIPSDQVYPPAGNLISGFAYALEESGIFEKVYYPTRPEDKVDLTLDARFDVTFKPNMGRNMIKSLLTGLTLFLFEPVFWYDFDYNILGEVKTSRGTTPEETIKAKTRAIMVMKFLSLSNAQTLEASALKQGKDATYKQLLQQLNESCTK